jgi:hypothetical protein
MPDGMEQFLWFIIGVFSYRIIASLLNYGHMHVFMSSLKEDILKLLFILEEDIQSAQDMKHRSLRSAKIDENELKETIEKDKQMANIWKEVIISRLKTQWPKYYKDLLTFNNWREARNSHRDNLKD